MARCLRWSGRGAALGQPRVTGQPQYPAAAGAALSLPDAPAPEVIGIDDWAKRKGHTYGTIIVDLDRHRPVDVLPDRTAETVAAWMQAHPEVKVVARDR